MNLGILSPPAWVERSLCTPDEAELWFPLTRGPDSRKARDVGPHIDAPVSVCKRCPVAEECLRYALENNERFGIYGGLTPHQRDQLRRRK